MYDNLQGDYTMIENTIYIAVRNNTLVEFKINRSALYTIQGVAGWGQAFDAMTKEEVVDMVWQKIVANSSVIMLETIIDAHHILNKKHMNWMLWSQSSNSFVPYQPA